MPLTHAQCMLFSHKHTIKTLFIYNGFLLWYKYVSAIRSAR